MLMKQLKVVRKSCEFHAGAKCFPFHSSAFFPRSLIPMPKVVGLKLIRISMANGENKRRCEQEEMKT